MIITKELEITINKRNIEHFRKHGYECKLRDIIMIKPIHLTKGSHTKVEVECVGCSSRKNVFYLNYVKQLKKYDFYCCKHCVSLKSIKTSLKKYNVINISQLEFVKELKRKTSQDRYGTDSPTQTDEVKLKISNTNNIRYGGNSPMCCPDVRMKSKKTVEFRYGESSISKCNFIKALKKETCLKNYGVENPSQSPYIRKKQLKSMFSTKVYNNTNLTYQGTYELDFLDTYYNIHHIENATKIDYKLFESNHVYFPDFYIPKLNLIVEIKSTYTYELELGKNLAKQTQCIKDGYNFIFIIDKDYTDFNIFQSDMTKPKPL